MAEVDTAEPTDAPQLELDGFEDAVEGLGNLPDPEQETPVADEGQPEQAEAVDESEAEDTPAEAPADEPAVNFDGFSDGQRSLFERLLSDGHVTPEEVEQERINTMFQADYTKRRMKEKAEHEAKLATIEERKEDLEILDKVRADDTLYERWLKLQEPADEDEDGDELVDRKTAAELARQEAERILAERDSRTKAEQSAYESKRMALVETGRSIMETLSIDIDTLNTYLAEEQKALPDDVDPILTVTPEDMRDRIHKRHEIAVKDAEITRLQEQLAGKTAKNERTAKQSLPPDRRVSTPRVDDPLAQTEAELGLDPDWSNVTGWGFPT